MENEKRKMKNKKTKKHKNEKMKNKTWKTKNEKLQILDQSINPSQFSSWPPTKYFAPPPWEGYIVYITWKIVWQLFTLTATAQLTPNRKSYQLSKQEIEFDVMEEMYAAWHMRQWAEKTTFLDKNDLT